MLTVTALSPRCLALTLGGDAMGTSWGANCLALAGRDGTLVVDPLVAPAQARLVEAALGARGWPPVTHAVLTHHHTDHALGAGWFAGRGALVACHRACAEGMAAQHPGAVAARRRLPEVADLFADAEPYRPALAFQERWSVDLGGLAVEALAVGPAHTAGDVAVLIPSEGVVAVGDLVFAGYHYNYEEATLERLGEALERVRALGASRVVPGHGPVGGAERLDEQARYHETVRRLVAGAATPEAAEARVLAAFPEHRYRAGVASAVARLRVGS